jgi:hypothetical protein
MSAMNDGYQLALASQYERLLECRISASDHDDSSPSILVGVLRRRLEHATTVELAGTRYVKLARPDPRRDEHELRLDGFAVDIDRPCIDVDR